MKTAVTPSQHVEPTQDEFLARGLRSSHGARQTGIFFAAEAVHDELAQRLEARRRQVLERDGHGAE